MDGDIGTVVVVEDDTHISDLVAMYLRRDGFRVLQAADGEAGLSSVGRERPRLVVVDVGLPGEIDGFEVCRRLRAQGSVPVVMLTARDDEVDRVLGLELGADDYVTKPFSARELVARVHAILRRSEARPTTEAPLTVVVGGVEIDTGRREARGPEGPVALTHARVRPARPPRGQPGSALLSRQQLLDGVWGRDWFGDERTVDVHVRQLRKKLGDALPLATVWGVGYRLD